jgi:prolyl oligopeptidase
MTKQIDPFSMLEDSASSVTTEFYNSRNKSADEYFVDSEIDHFASELLKIGETDLKGLPSKFGKYTFWAERKAEWQCMKLMVQKKGDEPQILLDFEESDESLGYWFPSEDGRKLIYGTSTNGNEQTTLYVYDVASMSKLEDEIPFAGYTDQGNVCWVTGSSFIYPRMNGFSESGPKDKWLLGTKLYMHKLGEDPKSDKLIYGKNSPDTVMMIPTLSSDKQKLYVAECRDELTHQIFVVDLITDEVRAITSQVQASFMVKAGKGKVYAITNFDAPRYRLLMCDEDDIETDFSLWDEVLPESRDILQDFWIHSSTNILAQYSHNVTSRLNIYDAYGNQTDILHLPKYGIIQGVVCSPTNSLVYYSVSSFALPTTHYRLDTLSGTPTVQWAREALPGDDGLIVEQYWVRQYDGCDVPYFLVKHKNTKNDAPCIIYGYGGFNIALEPSYLQNVRPWVLAGGVYVLANLRGGSEFGEDWHSGGAMEYKHNTFSDCISIAEDLISKEISSSEKLGVMGGSNGGLLVAGVTVQRPDLFRAGASLVPLTDMLEFYKHGVAEFWVHEYGDPRIPEQRAWMEEWSPYHYPIDKKIAYPALYYETALHDARVHPFHAFKMVARLEHEVTLWKGPLMLRTMTDTGHQSSNLSKKDLALRTAEYYAFFAKELGLNV